MSAKVVLDPLVGAHVNPALQKQALAHRKWIKNRERLAFGALGLLALTVPLGAIATGGFWGWVVAASGISAVFGVISWESRGTPPLYKRLDKAPEYVYLDSHQTELGFGRLPGPAAWGELRKIFLKLPAEEQARSALLYSEAAEAAKVLIYNSQDEDALRILSARHEHFRKLAAFLVEEREAGESARKALAYERAREAMLNQVGAHEELIVGATYLELLGSLKEGHELPLAEGPIPAAHQGC